MVSGSIAALLGALALGLIALWLVRRSRKPGAGWAAGPMIDGQDYSAPVAIGPDGSFDFPQAAPGIHYLTKVSGSLAGARGIALAYRIDADPGVTFHDAQDGHEITAGPMLYFQRAGDDWSGAGEFEAYRWWAESQPGSLAPGLHSITALFTDRWSAVERSNSDDNPEAFRAALSNAARLGLTFPNDSGAGHGIYASGPARFTLIAFDLQ